MLNRNVYIINKGYSGTGVAGFELKFCEYKLLKNLLESGNPCGIIELGGGDAFENLYRHQEGFKREFSNPNLDTKEYFEFDEKSMKTIINYTLYELKVFGNEHNEILDYIKNFLLGKVKYLFITGINKDIKIINSLLEIAKTTDTVFILQTSFREIPESLKNCVMDFNLDKKTKEFTISVVDDSGKLICSKPMKHYEDSGIGYIGEINMDKNLIEKVKEYIKDKKTFSITQLQLEFEIGYPEAREIVDVLIEEGLVKTNVDGKICVVSSKN